MTQKIKIRRVKDIFSIDESLTQHLWDIWRFTQPTWFTPARYFWVVFYGKKWIGYGCASVQDKETLYLGPTFISEKHRGKGLQKKLIRVREKFAQKKGFSYLISSVNYDNVVSAKNLETSGFIKCKPWNKLKPTGLYFRKNLRK